MEVGDREVGDDGAGRTGDQKEAGATGVLGRAGSAVVCPNVWAIMPHTGRAGCGCVRPDVWAIMPHTRRAGCGCARPDAVVRAGSSPCHTGRAAQPH